MILAGIDEAGLGPTLGPLCTASVGIECPDDWTPATPWEKLAGLFPKEPALAGELRKSGRNPVACAVCDSKVLYPAAGLGALETAVAVLNCLAHGTLVPQPVLSHPEAPIHPCYDGVVAPFAAVPDAQAVGHVDVHVRPVMEACRAGVVHFAIHVLHEPAFNDIIDSGKNKNRLLLEQTGRHLESLVRRFSKSRSLLVVVDKQGGRNDYLAFLARLFPDTWPEELEAGRERSRYRLRTGPGDKDGPVRPAEIVFQAKADRLSFPTAAASLAAKYLRERAMSNLNAWFGARVPGLKPTAGYPQDAKRWLSDVADRADELRLDLLVRKR